MLKIPASVGAISLLVCGWAGAAVAETAYSPPVSAPTYRYVMPAAALTERSELPSGLVYEGRSVHVRRPAMINYLPEAPAFPAGLPLTLEPTPRPSSTGSSFQTMYG
jgi:hypothetical protein